MISKAKKDYLCDEIVNCGSSWELFHLSSQMMGKLKLEILCFPQIFPLSIFLISLMNFLYIRLTRSDPALTLTDQFPLTQLNSLAQPLQSFNL